MNEAPTATLRLIFAGTPDFAVPSLEALMASGHLLLAVYTQPDRRAGRGRRVQASAVKRVAMDHGVEIHQPPTLRDPEAVDTLRALAPDLMVVAAYGLLLPRAVLAIPRLGCVNVHASLLPRWRGAAPVQHAILAGDTTTGITLMQMDPGLDTGAMLAQSATPIGAEETAGELTARLAALGGRLLGANVDAIAAGNLEAVAQDPGRVTHAPKIRKAQAEIDWQRPATDIARAVRAYDPWPVAQTHLDGRQLRIYRAAAPDGASARGRPGQVIAVGRDHFDVACGRGVLRVTQVQPAGKRRMGVRDYLNATDLRTSVFQHGTS